jgi:dihydroxyacetone kinase-like protein
MNGYLTQSDIVGWLEHFGSQIEEKQSRLDELDAATGHGEHGANLSRGVAAMRTVLVESAYADVQALFDAVGMAIVNSVGGASGALYGTLFLRLSDVGVDRVTLELDQLATGFASAAEGIAELGRCAPGDKTMLDALHPAVVALAGGGPSTALTDARRRAAVAAEEGRDSTAEMLARVGRGSYLGDRSLGHLDAGASSMAQLFRSLSETADAAAGAVSVR